MNSAEILNTKKPVRFNSPKIILIAFFVLISTAFSSRAQDNKAKDAVMQAVEEFRIAIIKADENVLDSLTSPLLSYGHSSGFIENKNEFIKTLISGKSKFVTLEISSPTIIIDGNTAIVRHALEGDTHDEGKPPGKVKLSVLLVWVKQNSKWVLLARQAVKV